MQEGAQPPVFAPGAAQGVVFKQIHKKSLGDVLGITGRMAAPPQKGVERRPVSLAKTGERLLRGRRRVVLRSNHHRAPLRRTEAGTPFLQGPWNCLHAPQYDRKMRVTSS